MKVFLRTLVVLLAALIIVGSALGISSLKSTSTSNTTGTVQSESTRPQRPAGEEFERDDRGGESFNLMGLGSVGMNLIKVSLIVAPFAVVANIQQRRKQSRRITA